MVSHLHKQTGSQEQTKYPKQSWKVASLLKPITVGITTTFRISRGTTFPTPRSRRESGHLIPSVGRPETDNTPSTLSRRRKHKDCSPSQINRSCWSWRRPTMLAPTGSKKLKKEVGLSTVIWIRVSNIADPAKYKLRRRVGHITWTKCSRDECQSRNRWVRRVLGFSMRRSSRGIRMISRKGLILDTQVPRIWNRTSQVTQDICIKMEVCIGRPWTSWTTHKLKALIIEKIIRMQRDNSRLIYQQLIVVSSRLLWIIEKWNRNWYEIRLKRKMKMI